MPFENSDNIQSKVLEKGKAQDSAQDQQRWLDEILNSSKDSLPVKPNDTSARVSDLFNSMNKARSGERPAEVQIADILSRNNDFGNDVKKARVNEMFREAMEKGPKAVDKLITNINKELEKNGSGMQLEGKQILKFTDIHSDMIMKTEPPQPIVIGRERQETVKLTLTNKHGETEDIFTAEGRKERIPTERELRNQIEDLLSEPRSRIIPGFRNENPHERKQSEWQLDRPLFKIPLSQMPVLSPYINRAPSGVVSDLSNRIVWP
ncbi:MAG: hypothetical protein IAF58_09115 [Leptolyngbya sp.]|nr:hypothetical protein [Candidatus Melainabacteria bacterium]